MISRDDAKSVLGAVTTLRDQVADAELPLDIPGVAAGRATRDSLLKQLDDYVIPRLRSLDAPLLAVVGGSTGAGKSTLVNSIVDAQVSRSGVLRPTTTTPVLVHHPKDERWFLDDRILPGLSRVTGAVTGDDGAGSALRLVRLEVAASGHGPARRPRHRLGRQRQPRPGRPAAGRGRSLAVRDDGGPVRRRRPVGPAARGVRARHRVAIVLDRVPPEAMADIRGHLASMLREQGLSTAPIFGIPEAELTAEGRLPEADVARLRSWLSALASDARARSVIVKQTLEGALGALEERTASLVASAHEQAAAVSALHDAAELSYRGRGPPRRARHDRRHAPSRRGARPLAGVRRHG